MRRMAVIVSALASCAVIALVAPTAASAHVCITPVEVKVGQLSAITVGVPAELQPVVAVRITVPDGFRLGEARPAAGWTASVDGTAVTYRGGTIGSLQCGYFTVTGTATRKAKLVFPVAATGADGSTTDYGPGRLGAQEVYAGVKPFADTGRAKSNDTALVAGVVLVVLGVAAAVVLVIRRRAPRR